MTRKQMTFADIYIQCGNVSEAARQAGYKSRRSGFNLLNDKEVATYIADRIATLDAARIAKSDEIMRFYTAVMRGEINDKALLTQRLRAADSLLRRHAAAEDRNRATLDKLDEIMTEFKRSIGQDGQ